MSSSFHSLVKEKNISLDLRVPLNPPTEPMPGSSNSCSNSTKEGGSVCSDRERRVMQPLDYVGQSKKCVHRPWQYVGQQLQGSHARHCKGKGSMPGHPPMSLHVELGLGSKFGVWVKGFGKPAPVPAPQWTACALTGLT